MAQRPTIAIIGGGLGGLTLANVLHRRGFDSVVFERDADPSARPQGGTLDLHGDTGQRALREAGLEVNFRRVARYEDQGMRLFHPDGRLLADDEDPSGGDRPEIDPHAVAPASAGEASFTNGALGTEGGEGATVFGRAP